MANYDLKRKRAQRHGHAITYQGVTHPSITALAKAYGKPVASVFQRLQKGWSVEEALEMLPAPRKTTGHEVKLNGRTYSSRKKACEELGIDPRLVHSRLKSGRSLEEAFGLRDFDYATKPKFVVVEGRSFSSYGEACRHYGVDKYVLNARINRYGWTLEEALEVARRPGYEKGVVGFVYLIEHKRTGKQYVGITMGTLDQRWEQHMAKAMSGKRLGTEGLHQTIYRDGAESFQRRVLCKAYSLGELNELEASLIERLNTRAPRGFNLNGGGAGTRTAGKPVIVQGLRFESITAACRHFRMDRRRVTQRLLAGWTPEQALELAPRREHVSDPKVVTIDGQEFSSMSKAAEHFGLEPDLVGNRLRGGWPIEEAVGLTARQQSTRIKYRGHVYRTHSEFCKAFGLVRSTFNSRINRGWSVEQCLGLKPPPGRSGS